MGEKQGNKDLATHVRNCEDFLKNLIRLEVHSISAEDLVAIVANAGINETHRTEFMKRMTIYNRAVEYQDSPDDESSARSSKPKMSLCGKVREFTPQGRYNSDQSKIKKQTGQYEYYNSSRDRCVYATTKTTEA